MTRAWGGWKPPGEGRWATPQAAQRRHGRHRTPFPVAMGDAGTESSPVEQMERMDWALGCGEACWERQAPAWQSGRNRPAIGILKHDREWRE
jgi:hypothetical protein